ncbi:NYN domain-containing protein [Candidatus Babeliales bacterium]|nr:NYN domain-containing protein [Candidatus Babeliales bacterium]
MYLIIDGYNLLKTMLGAQESSEKKKSGLIAALVSYARRKEHTISVVFDGGLTQHLSQEYYGTRVRVVHAGYHKSADDLIKKLLHETKDRECVLISSDNELIEAAYYHNVIAVDASAFAHVLGEKEYKKNAHQRDATLRKLNEHAEHEIDELMEEMSRNIPLKHEEVGLRRTRARTTQSKYEKRIMKVLKKL